jgi:hypothetical protein
VKQRQLHHLGPRALNVLLTICIYSETSAFHQRLLHAISNVVTTWKDDVDLEKAHKLCKLRTFTIEEIGNLRYELEFILIRTLVPVVVNGGVESINRRIALQILTALVQGSEQAHGILSDTESSELSANLMIESEDHMLRLLSADLLRERLNHGVAEDTAWPTNIPPEFRNMFPMAERSDHEWLRDIQNYLSDIDKSRSFRER